ncbi:MAG: hypothetical protein J6O50_02375 [Ruminiclostridium sp.]|nr:hypothetical protein [Ruminiclostridium sp.]
MENIKVTVIGGDISPAERQAYIERGKNNKPNMILTAVRIELDGDFADITYQYADPPQDMTVSIGGCMIGKFGSFNHGKQAEYLDRIPNDLN